MVNDSVPDTAKKLICFIDDSTEERELFKSVFGSEEGAFQIICGESFAAARKTIAGIEKVPVLFVLDLYFPDSDNVESKRVSSSGPVTLPNDEGDIGKAFLNLEIAQRRYREIRAATGQSPNGGLRLIKQVQEAYPGVPVVTYTRKGTIEDAEKALRAGARQVVQKPSGDLWEDTYRLTKELRTDLERKFHQAIAVNPFEVLNQILHYAALMDPTQDLEALHNLANEIRNKLNESKLQHVSIDDIDRLMDCTSHPFLRALMFLLRSDFPRTESSTTGSES